MGSITKSVEGKIIRVNEETGEVTIKVDQADFFKFGGNVGSCCDIQFLNQDKKLSKQQRRFCYSLLNSIAEWAGMRLEESKRIMKDKFIEDYIGDYVLEDFSLKDAPMELICDFQDFLIDFILAYDIPTKESLKSSVSIEKYIYACIRNRKCCICGKGASLYTNNGLSIPVCGSHRIELLTEGSVFYEKYHVEPISYSENEDMS